MINLTTEARTIPQVHSLLSSYVGDGIHPDALETFLVPFDGFQFHQLEDGNDTAPGVDEPGEAYDEQALPVTLGSASELEATFIADGTAGARLDEVVDTTGTGSQSYDTDLLDAGPGWSVATLWRLEGRSRTPDGSTTEFVIEADAAQRFRSYTISGLAEENIVLDWSGIEVPGTESTLWVRLVVRKQAAQVAGTGERVTWFGFMGPENGRDVQVRTFSYPILRVDQFADPVAAEDANLASYRLRLLVPNNFTPNKPFLVPNQAVGIIANLLITKSGSGNHPASFQPLPFISLTSASPANASNFRRSLVLTALDPEGWIKQFAYEVGLTSSGTGAAVEMCPAVLIPRERALAVGPIERAVDGKMLLPEDEWGATYAPRYAVDITAFQGSTDDFWFPICERYRARYRDAVNPPLTKANPDYAVFRKEPSVINAHIWPFAQPDIPYAAGLLRIVETWNKLFESLTWLDRDHKLWHFQTWVRDFADVAHCREDFADVAPGIPQLWSDMRDLGWRVTAYTRVGDDDPFVNGMQWRHLYRRGIYFTANPDGVTFAELEDFQRDIAWSRFHLEWPAECASRFVARLLSRFPQLGGMYLDTYTGGNRLLGTPGGEGGPRVAPSYGGRFYTQQKRLSLPVLTTKVRSILGAEAPVLTENFEEGTYSDWQNQGYSWFPGHLTNDAEDVAVAVLTSAPAPAELVDQANGFKNLYPPILSAVHHAWQMHGHFTPPVEATGIQGHPSQTMGMTEAEYLDQLRYGFALLWSIGVYQMNLGGSPLDTDYSVGVVNGALANTMPAVDTTGVGLLGFDFIRYLLANNVAAHAAPYLVDGVMEAPLGITSVATATNPAECFVRVTSMTTPSVYVNGNWFVYETGNPLTNFGNNAFVVDTVLSSCWHDEAGDTHGVVLVNWTAAAQAPSFTWTAASYGVTGNYNVTIKVLGSPDDDRGTFSAATLTIDCSVGVDTASEVFVGNLPAASVALVVITQVP